MSHGRRQSGSSSKGLGFENAFVLDLLVDSRVSAKRF
jgi:hypothetical protein